MEVGEATQEIERRLADLLERRSPSLFEGRWWEDRILAWAADDRAVRLQMLRFADVLSSLKTHTEIAAHLQEYYLDVQRDFPDAEPLSLIVDDENQILQRALAWNARSHLRRLAARFVTPPAPRELTARLHDHQRHGFLSSLCPLGPRHVSHAETDAAAEQLRTSLADVVRKLSFPTESVHLDPHSGELIPQLQLELPLSRFLPQPVRLANFDQTLTELQHRLAPLISFCREEQVALHFPAEFSSWNCLTVALLEHLVEQQTDDSTLWIGVDVDAALHTADEQLTHWLSFAETHDLPLQIRLVRGIQVEEERLQALRSHRASPVRNSTAEIHTAYLSLSERLLNSTSQCRPAFAVHDLPTVSRLLAMAETHELSPADFELEFRDGIAGELALLLVEEGWRVRKSCGVADPLAGMAVLAKELLENPSRVELLHQNFTLESVSRNIPCPTVADTDTPTIHEETAMSNELAVFEPEPLLDFSDASSREAMSAALRDVGDQLGEEYFPIIHGRTVETRNTLVSRNPSRTEEVIGRVAAASPEEVTAAVEAAVRASSHWSQEAPQFRAEYLELLAREIRQHRLELAAWIVLEAGKTRESADAEVAAAIDDCFSFAQTIRQISGGQQQSAFAEQQLLLFRPRGVAAVIASFESPLGSLLRMTAAALVTGNTVILKPSRRTPVIAARLMSLIQTVGFPDGVVNYLPGLGEEIGLELARSPEVDLVLFSGTQETARQIQLAIAEEQAPGFKPLITELHAACPILLDDDADLDDAIPGILQTACGFAGQHSLNCSHVIVSEQLQGKFLKRFTAAVASLKTGPASDPATTLGPLIDEDCVEEIRDYQSILDDDETLTEPLTADKETAAGCFAMPWIITGLNSASRHLEQRLPGPGLAVITVADFESGLEVLRRIPDTGAAVIYSRSPAHLDLTRERLGLNHLYLNRTPADPQILSTRPLATYDLQAFQIPVTITENQRRRGMIVTSPADE